MSKAASIIEDDLSADLQIHCQCLNQCISIEISGVLPRLDLSPLTLVHDSVFMTPIPVLAVHLVETSKLLANNFQPEKKSLAAPLKQLYRMRGAPGMSRKSKLPRWLSRNVQIVPWYQGSDVDKFRDRVLIVAFRQASKLSLM